MGTDGKGERVGGLADTIEAPCHELFDDEEDENGGDVVLNRNCKQSASQICLRG